MHAALASRFDENMSEAEWLWRVWMGKLRKFKKPLQFPVQRYGGMNRIDFDRYCRGQAAEWDEYVKTTPETPLPPQ